MVEAVPERPYGSTLKDILEVEPSMRRRYEVAGSLGHLADLLETKDGTGYTCRQVGSVKVA